MGSTVVWPSDPLTGEVFDGLWLERGTRVKLTVEEKLDVDTAYVAGLSNLPDGSPPSKAQIREYWRVKNADQQHASYLAMPPPLRAAATVRGRGLQEWGEHIDHLKRTGHLQSALDLTGECIEAALRLKITGERINLESWIIRAAIILRKMADYETEIQLVEGAIERFPQYGKLEARLPRSRHLLAKSAPPASL